MNGRGGCEAVNSQGSRAHDGGSDRGVVALSRNA